LGANALTTIGGNSYDTTAHDFAGSVSSLGALDYPNNPPGTIPAGFQYVLGKFGSASYVWYLGNQSFDISDLSVQGGGLSHWVAFNPSNTDIPVPDSGSAVALLGLALALLAVARRRLA
jgi:hypothetical protein